MLLKHYKTNTNNINLTTKKKANNKTNKEQTKEENKGRKKMKKAKK